MAQLRRELVSEILAIRWLIGSEYAQFVLKAEQLSLVEAADLFFVRLKQQQEALVAQQEKMCSAVVSSATTSPSRLCAHTTRRNSVRFTLPQTHTSTFESRDSDSESGAETHCLRRCAASKRDRTTFS